MLKQILIVVLAALLLLIAACAGFLIWAQRSGAETQERFFKAVDSGDAAEVLALCDPSLREEIDEPILAAWIKEVRQRLGKFQALSKTEFETSTKVTNDGQITESKGLVQFEHGTAHSELVFRNGLLVRFSIHSDRIPDDWFQGPGDSTLYQARGKEFLTRFLNRDTDGAYSLMHEKLKEVMPRDKLKTMIEDISAKVGPLQTVTFVDDKFSATEGQKLKLNYRAKCEQKELAGEVEFGFVGMKGHLIGFNVRSPME